MRKLETKYDQEKKDRRNKIIIGVILVAVMALGPLGYSLRSGNKNSEGVEKVSYNGFDFYKQGDYWQTVISGNNFYFSYLPNETESISIKRSVQDYSGKPLYLASRGLAEEEILRNLQYAAERTQFACLEDSNCTEDLPIKNCSSNIIIVKEQAVTKSIVNQEDNCIFILANSSEIVRAADSFLYKILGIK